MARDWETIYGDAKRRWKTVNLAIQLFQVRRSGMGKETEDIYHRTIVERDEGELFLAMSEHQLRVEAKRLNEIGREAQECWMNEQDVRAKRESSESKAVDGARRPKAKPRRWGNRETDNRYAPLSKWRTRVLSMIPCDVCGCSSSIGYRETPTKITFICSFCEVDRTRGFSGNVAQRVPRQRLALGRIDREGYDES